MERKILKELIERLNIYNGEDMLEGYLNPLADLNPQLKKLGLPEIELVNDEDDDWENGI